MYSERERVVHSVQLKMVKDGDVLRTLDDAFSAKAEKASIKSLRI